MNGSEAQLTIGADLEMTDYYLSSSMGIQEVDQRIYAYYLQGVFPINEQLSVTAGARRALVRNHITDSFAFAGGENLDDEVTVGTFGVVFQPNQAWRLFARADENFRFAKVDEHTSIFGATTGLENQTGISYEIGGEWTGDSSSFKATVYHLKLENEIIYDSTAGFFGQNVNLDKTRRKGVMLEASTDLTRNVTVGLNYNYVDAEITSGTFDGNIVPLVAAHSSTLLIDYSPTSYFDLHAEIKYIGDRFLGGDFANAIEELDAFTVVNMSGEYRTNGWRIGAKVNNLLDKEYIETGATAFNPWPTVVGSYFPSPERNFWVTVGYDYF
jgi:iron complex outermembrane receptor protein